MNLTGANLANADLSRCRVSGADFTGADLTHAELGDIDTPGSALLRDTDLRGTYLGAGDEGSPRHQRASHYEYANALLIAHTHHGTFLGARWSEETYWPPSITDEIRDRSEHIEPGTWQITRT